MGCEQKIGIEECRQSSVRLNKADPVCQRLRLISTDFLAYYDTSYNDTPVTVAVLTVSKWPYMKEN